MKRAIFFLLVAASALVAEDFWKAKEASQWSEKDVRKMLRDSPWAKEITLSMPGSGMRRGAGGGDIGGVGDISGGMSDSGGASMGGGMGGGGGRGGRNRASLPVPPEGPKVVVRWETAAPVREAATKAGLGTIRPEAVEKFYVVSITGFPLRGAAGAQGEGQDRFKEMREALMKETVLKRKDKDPVVPVRVDVLPGPQGATLMFIFLRSVEIGADDKEVVFSTRMGPTQVNSKFQLKNMVYHGALAL